jgi:uridine kinase
MVIGLNVTIVWEYSRVRQNIFPCGNFVLSSRFVYSMSVVEPNIDLAVFGILDRRAESDARRSILAGVSGIDGSGKGYVANQIVQRLLQQHRHAVVLPGDGWLNLPTARFNTQNPSPHFYENALRMDEMLEQLVLPLQRKRSHSGIMNFTEETAPTYRSEPYAFQNVDVIVLECIFLFKRRYRHHFDFAIWIDCSFETALKRAIARRQENLPEDETIRAYETIYFPAQRIHLREDRPRETADLIIKNDG